MPRLSADAHSRSDRTRHSRARGVGAVGGNMQPWRVYALAGKRVEELVALLARAHGDRIVPRGEGTDYTSIRAAGRALQGAAFRSRRIALSGHKRAARRQAGALPTICAQLSILRRAGRAVLRARESAWARRNGPTSAAICRRWRCWRADTACTLARNRLGCHLTAPCVNSLNSPTI